MQLHFRKLGSGPPLIILHGLYGSGDNWYSIGRALSKNFTIYLVDLRNHGLSPHDAVFNYEVMTADLEEFFTDIAIEKACVLGHSMGGKVAMNFALKHQTQVEKLVIIDIALRSYSQSPQFEQHKKIIEALRHLAIDTNPSRLAIDDELAITIPQASIRQFLLKNLKRNESNKFYWGFNLEALRNNMTELLQNIDTGNSHFKNPVLVIRGINSGYITDSDLNTFHHIFSAMRIEDFETGHWVHAEQPEKLITLLLDFLLVLR
jgi:esterase